MATEITTLKLCGAGLTTFAFLSLRTPIEGIACCACCKGDGVCHWRPAIGPQPTMHRHTAAPGGGPERDTLSPTLGLRSAVRVHCRIESDELRGTCSIPRAPLTRDRPESTSGFPTSMNTLALSMRATVTRPTSRSIPTSLQLSLVGRYAYSRGGLPWTPPSRRAGTR